MKNHPDRFRNRPASTLVPNESTLPTEKSSLQKFTKGDNGSTSCQFNSPLEDFFKLNLPDAFIKFQGKIKPSIEYSRMLFERLRASLLVVDQTWAPNPIPNEKGRTLGGNPVVDGAEQGGSVLRTRGWTLPGALQSGDVLTISGVYAAKPPDFGVHLNTELQYFRVTADFTPDASGRGAVTITPPLHSFGDKQNIEAPPVDGAAITVLDVEFDYINAPYAVAAPAVGDGNRQKAVQKAVSCLDFILAMTNAVDEKSFDTATKKDLESSLQALKQNSAANDYFGLPFDWVPLEPFGYHAEALDKSLNYLHDTEQAFLEFWKARNDVTRANSQLHVALTQAENAERQIATEIAATHLSLKLSNQAIIEGDNECETAKNKLDSKLGKWKDTVKSAFGVSWGGVFNFLQQMAFFPVSMPAETPPGPRKADPTKHPRRREGEPEPTAPAAGHSNPFGQWSMVLGQGGQLVHDAINNIVTDSGESISKEHVLGKIRLIEKNFKEAVKVKQKGDGSYELDEPNKLLMAQEALDELLNDFYSYPEAKRVEDAMENYVRAVLNRNDEMLQFNLYFISLGKLLTEKKLNEAQRAKIRELINEVAKPDLGARTSVMRAIYDHQRDFAIARLYKAARAFSFWMVKPYNPLQIAFEAADPDTFDRLDYSVLHKAQMDMINKDFEGFEERSKNELVYFPGVEDPNATGVFFEIKREIFPALFEALEKNLHVQIRLRACRKNDERHPFAGWANVRLTKARAWMVGMSTKSGNHKVDLIHEGEETVVTVEDQPYRLKHYAKQISLEYDGRDLASDYENINGNIRVKHVAKKFKRGGSDGDLFKTLDKKHICPIGPFATWTVSVTKESNLGLNLSNCNVIALEFHGYRQSFPPR